jgi:hypothetical protein
MTDEERLEDLLDRWEQSRADGSRPTPEELCRDCPELLETFRERLRRLARLDGFLQDGTTPPGAPSTVNWPFSPQGTPSDKPLQSEEPTLPAVPGYEVLGVLGRGGMGVVYQARQVALGRVVALKMIRDGVLAGPRERARFRAEAKAVARLQHPNIVQVHDLGEQDGRPFFSLELCQGGSLDKKLAGKPMVPRKAARLIEILARAVQAAHQAGVLHRDLKPANVLLTRDNVPKITDFGLAKQLGEPGPTCSGAILGTPAYMAPEQAGGKSREVGPAADVYALGAILYECLTGRPPFRGETPLDILRQVMSDAPEPPRRLRPDVPAALESICLHCLQKQPSRRYPTAAALAADLQCFLADRPTVARPIRKGARASRWLRRRSVVAALSAALLLLVLGGTAAVIAWRMQVMSNTEKAEADARERQAAERAAEAEERKVAELLRALGQDGGALPSTERAAFRDLAAAGDRVRLRFLEKGLQQPDTAARLGRRSARVVQAVVGLNTARREKASELVLAGLSDERADPQVRQACLFLGTALGLDGREVFCRAGMKVAAAALTRTADPHDLANLAEAIGWSSAFRRSSAPDRLKAELQPANRERERLAAVAAGCLLDALPRATTPQTQAAVMRGLAALAPCLTPNDAAVLVDRLPGAMAQTGDAQVLAALVRAVGVLAGRLEQEQKERVGGEAAARLHQAAILLLTGDPKLLAEIARAMAMLPGRQAAEQSEQLAGLLLSIVHLRPDPAALVEVARGVFVLVDRLEPDKGAALAAAAANQLLGALFRSGMAGLRRVPVAPGIPVAAGPADPGAVYRLVQALDRLAERLPAGEDKRAPAGTAAGMLTAAAFQGTSAAVADALARTVVRFSGQLSSAKAEELVRQLLNVMGRAADPHVLAGLVRAVAALAARLPPDRSVRLDAALAGRLLDALDTAADPYSLAGLGEAVAVLLVHGPGGPATGGRLTAALDRLLGVLGRTADPYARIALGHAVAALAGCAGPARGARPVAAAVDSLLDAMARTDEPDTLADLLPATAALFGRLDPQQRRKPAAAAMRRAFEVPAALGREAEALAAELPSSDLAILLGDPACVDQGRRLLLRELAVRIGPPLPAGEGVAAACAALPADPFLAAAAMSCGAGLYPGGHRPFAGVWEAVDYLRAHHPEFDLSGPPPSGR